MQRNNKLKTTALGLLKNLFTKNIAIKAVSLLFAMLVWGYVMMDQNPVRTKTIDSVSVNFEGESDLIARRLIISGERDKALQKVTVRFNTELTKYADLDANDIYATISLRNISGPGVYTIPINAVTADGKTALSVSPSSVTIEVDDLVSKPIPVEVSLSGKLKEGYWHGDPVLASSIITVQGAAGDVQAISSAACEIDLTELETSYNESTPVVLRNTAGEPVNATLLGTLPAIPVQLEVLRMASLRIRLDEAIIGRENISVNHEIVNYWVQPAEVITVIGDKDVIEGLSGIDIEPVDVSGRKDSFENESKLLLPEGVVSLNGDAVNVFINIRQIIQTLTFEELPIEVVGLGRKLACTLDIESTDLTLTGRIGLMNELSRKEVVPYVDVTGLGAGRYEIELRLKLPTEQMLSEINSVFAVQKVAVTIKND